MGAEVRLAPGPDYAPRLDRPHAPTGLDLDALMQDLGYTRDWLACGVIDAAELQRQHAAMVRGDDPHPEHWRLRAFHAFVDGATGFSAELLLRLIRLEDRGPDRTDLRAERLRALVGSRKLTPLQLRDLPRLCPAVLQPPVQRLYERELLLHRLQVEGAVACFADVEACADAHVQLQALQDPQLGRHELSTLATNGCNRQVRHVARDRLRRHSGQGT